MSLEDIEKKFYSADSKDSKNVVSEIKHEPVNNDVSKDEKSNVFTAPQSSSPVVSPWKEDHINLPSSTNRLFVAIGSIIFTLLAVFVGFWLYNYFFGNGINKSPISLALYSPEQVYRGVPFDFRVDITNEKNTPIDGSISFSFSSGLIPENISSVTESIGEMSPGETKTKTIRVFATGNVGSLEKINVSFSSKIKKSIPITQEKEIIVKEPGIRLTIENNQLINENAKFEIKIKYENISTVTFQNAALEARFPSSFLFLNANIPQSQEKNIWILGDIKPKGKGELIIQGAATGTEIASLKIPIIFSSIINGERLSLLEDAGILTATPRPLLVEFLGAGASTYNAKIGSVPSYTLRVKNNTNIGLSDVVVLVKLQSPLFNFSKTQTNGTFNSEDDSIEWSAAQIKKLRTLKPSEIAEMNFKIPLITTFPIKTASDKNFLLKGVVEITSPTVAHGSSADKTFVSVPFENKVIGDAVLEAKAWRKDSMGIINTGILPPRVNKPLQYTVHWKITNYSTNIRNVKIKSALEAGVKFTGIVKSNTQTKPIINDRTNIVEWTIPFIESGTGILTPPLEGVFQIEALPNSAQIGRFLPLVQETSFEATDDFTGVIIRKNYDKITSFIKNDPTFKNGDEKVIQ